MTIRKRISRYLMIAVMLTSGMTAVAQSPNSGLTLEGAWNVAIVFNEQGLPSCAPAPAVAIATAPGHGTIIADSCWASEGAGYGAWARTSNNQFAITFIGSSFAPNGTVESTYKVRSTVSLDPNANTFSGTFQTQVFDLGGVLLATFTGTIKAVRVVVEP